MKSFAIKIGKGRNPMTLDAGEVLGNCVLIQGARKSGKSYLARVIVEQTIPKMQTIILDADGEFFTLREKFNLLIAGTEGDVPCEVRSAKLLARRIAETGVSAVVDFSDLPLDDELPEDRRLFVKAFLHEFNNLPKAMYDRPRLFVLDEAHVYCPEKGQGTAASTQEVVLLQSQGRKRGFGTILLTQRLSKLKKDAASECGTILIGKTSPIDKARATDLLGIERKEGDGLKRLKPGMFYGDGNALPVEEPVLFQVCKSQTTHLEPGARHEMVTPPPQRAIKKILAEFEALPPPKDVEDAQTLAEAQRHIRELDRDLRRAQSTKPNLEDVEDVVETAVNKATALLNKEAARAESELRRIYEGREGALRKEFADFQRKTAGAVERLNAIVQSSPVLELPAVPKSQLTPVVQAKLQRASERRRVPPPSATDSIEPNGFSWKSVPGRMLTAVVQYYPTKLPLRRLAALAGVPYNKSTFRNGMSKLRTAVYLCEGSDGVGATGEAYSTFKNVVEPLPSGDEVVEHWQSKLGAGAPRRIFDAALELGSDGEPIDLDVLAAAAEVERDGSTLRNGVSKLRTKGLFEPGRGNPVLAEHVRI